MADFRKFGPQYMQSDGSIGSRRPEYLRPIPPPKKKEAESIQISEAAARKIAEALRIMLRSK